MQPAASQSTLLAPQLFCAQRGPLAGAREALLASSATAQLVRYGIVSAVALAADFGTLYTLTQYLHVYYLVSAAVAFLLGVAMNYALSLAWVFGQRACANRSMEFAIFAGIGVVGLGLNEAGMWFIREHLGLHYLAAKAMTTSAVFFWNFGARKALLFSAAAASAPERTSTTPAESIAETGWLAWRKAVPVAAFAYFIVAAVSVGYTRLPFVDEGVFAASAINLVKTGLTGDPSVPPWGLGIPLPQSQVHNFWVMPGFLYSLAAWFRLFPATLHSARGLSVLFGIIDLVLIYRFIRIMSRSTALAVLALVLLATDFNMIVRVATARMDSMSLALNFASWLAYLQLRGRSLPLAIGLGCALGSLSMLVHPNGIFAFAGLAVLVLAMDSHRIGWRPVAAAIIASATPLVLLLPLYLRAPDVWQAQMRNHSQGRFISFLHPLHALALEFQGRYFGQFGGTDPFELSPKAILLLVLAAYACAVIFTIVTFRRRSRLQIISVSLFGITAIYFTFFEAGHFYPYNIHLLPWFCIMLAGTLLALAHQHRKLAGAVCGVVVFINMAATATYIHEDRYHKNYLPVVERVASEMGPNDLLLSYSYFGIPLGFDRVTEDYTLVDVLRRHPRFVTLNPSHFLLNGPTKTWVNGPDPEQAGMLLPGEKAAATAYFQSHYAEVLSNRDFMLYRRVSE